ncbi:MAG: glycosyltransferase [Angustibacter sp.]
MTTSSEFQDDAALVRTALLALAAEPVHVVATMPAGVPGDLDVPDNATVVPFVPHGLVLERACVAVTHGGMGATQKALAHGVPVCVVPYGRDQLEVARRVEVSGAGARLPRRRLRPDALRAAVERARARADGARWPRACAAREARQPPPTPSSSGCSPWHGNSRRRAFQRGVDAPWLVVLALSA